MEHTINDADGDNPVQVTVLFFAKCRELVEQSSAQIKLSRTLSGSKLIEAILYFFPSLAEVERTLIVAVNQQYIERDSQVELLGGEEIAVIPPISGG